MMVRPDFMDSPYFVPEPDNWHLKPDAPEELKKKFEEYMKSYEKTHSDRRFTGTQLA
jgi:hypothetical protein